MNSTLLHCLFEFRDFGGRRENARTTKTKRTELEINKTNKGV